MLDISAKNPGDYGRKLLRVLYTADELKTSMLPSTVGDRYVKPKLDAERYQVLHSKLNLLAFLFKDSNSTCEMCRCRSLYHAFYQENFFYIENFSLFC